MPVTVLGYPATSDRSRGWLRYMYRKATTEDNWDKEGHPHKSYGWTNLSIPGRPEPGQQTRWEG